MNCQSADEQESRETESAQTSPHWSIFAINQHTNRTNKYRIGVSKSRGISAVLVTYCLNYKIFHENAPGRIQVRVLHKTIIIIIASSDHPHLLLCTNVDAAPPPAEQRLFLKLLSRTQNFFFHPVPFLLLLPPPPHLFLLRLLRGLTIHSSSFFLPTVSRVRERNASFSVAVSSFSSVSFGFNLKPTPERRQRILVFFSLCISCYNNYVVRTHAFVKSSWHQISSRSRVHQVGIECLDLFIHFVVHNSFFLRTRVY